MSRRSGFTLIEVLISIALLSMIMLALYKSLEIQRISNKKVHLFLDRSLKADKMIMVLYNDILHSNGVISEQKAKMGPVCIDETSNSLYGLSYAKVCWIVGKNDDTLVRIEGNDYKLPVRSSVKVELDTIAKGIKIFSVTRKKDKVLVVLQLAGEEPYAFVVEGIESPKARKRDKEREKKERIRRIKEAKAARDKAEKEKGKNKKRDSQGDSGANNTGEEPSDSKETSYNPDDQGTAPENNGNEDMTDTPR